MNMNLDDPRLTAYALNDPSLSDAERSAIEAEVNLRPELQATIDDIRQTSEWLTLGLKAEQATLTPVTAVPKVQAKRSSRAPWIIAGALGACVALGIGLMDQIDRANIAQVTEHGNADKPDGAKHASVTEPADVASATQQSLAKPLALASGPEPAPVGDKAAEGTKVEANAERGRKAPLGMASAEAAKPATLPAPVIPAGPTPIFGSGGAPGAGGPAGYGDVGGKPSGGGMPTTASPPAPGVYAPADLERLRENATNAKRSFSGVPPEGTPPSEAKPDYEDRRKQLADEAPGGKFDRIEEAKFIKVEGAEAVSTFGVDVDTASYSIVRRFLQGGTMPPPTAVRLEEIVNYFPYQDKAPEGDDPYAVRVELAECPWAPKHHLARIAVKAKPIATDKRPPSNLVFLIDVSGSMNAPNRLPLVIQSLKLLLNQLGENDRVAIVVYAGNAGLVLDSTAAVNKTQITEALDRLGAGGSTNGAGGIMQAYDVAVKNFIKNGTNRVILCTDGDFNVGTSSTDGLISLIEEKRKTGVFLSVFGFGMGNLRDEMMVKLAGKGNGNYAYIDTLKEAHKALVEQASGTLVTVAKDVKIQVEFNPAVIGSYRLLGYEKRALATQDFNDDKKDAGEMGAGHVVTALYELIPAGSVADAPVDGLRYQPAPAAAPAAKPADVQKKDEAFIVKMRHKKPDADNSTYRELPVGSKVTPYADASEDFRFSASAASFALLLQNSAYKGNATFSQVIDLAANAMKHDPSGYRAEFLEVVRLAQRTSGQK